MDGAEATVQLVACPVCHSQYDVSQLAAAQLTCRCGETIENRKLAAVDAVIARCGSCGAQIAPDAQTCAYCDSAIVRDPRKLSLICPECFARNAEQSRFCVACGVAFAPQALPGEGRELPCPACDTRMPPSQPVEPPPTRSAPPPEPPVRRPPPEEDEVSLPVELPSWRSGGALNM